MLRSLGADVRTIRTCLITLDRLENKSSLAPYELKLARRRNPSVCPYSHALGSYYLINLEGRRMEEDSSRTPFVTALKTLKFIIFGGRSCCPTVAKGDEQ